MSSTSERGPDEQRSHMSEDEAREYMNQLRSAPAEQVVTEVLSAALNAAQVKLGRRDARLLIDLSAVMLDHVREHVSEDLAKQVDHALGQLRLGQVQAEREGRDEPNDLAKVPASPASSGQSAGTRASSAASSSSYGAASKLWVPGR